MITYDERALGDFSFSVFVEKSCGKLLEIGI